MSTFFKYFKSLEQIDKTSKSIQMGTYFAGPAGKDESRMAAAAGAASKSVSD